MRKRLRRPARTQLRVEELESRELLSSSYFDFGTTRS